MFFKSFLFWFWNYGFESWDQLLLKISVVLKTLSRNLHVCWKQRARAIYSHATGHMSSLVKPPGWARVRSKVNKKLQSIFYSKISYRQKCLSTKKSLVKVKKLGSRVSNVKFAGRSSRTNIALKDTEGLFTKMWLKATNVKIVEIFTSTRKMN